MLSFKEWLIESAKLISYRDSNAKELQYKDKVDNVPLEIKVTKYKHEPRKHVHVDFTVRDSFSTTEGKDIPPETKARIVRRIGEKISDFVQKNKPRKMTLVPNMSDKIGPYTAFARSIAARHGGEVTSGEMKGFDLPRIDINFPKGRKKVSEEFTPEQMKIANATSRTMGAIGANAVVPRHVRQIAKKEDKILDFGAGKHAAHAQSLKGEGYNVTAHEFGDNQVKGLHDPQALSRKYDLAYASNVLNVQSSPEMLGKTLDQIKGSLHPHGSFIANLPASPRKYDELTGDHLKGELEKRFHEVERIGGTKSIPVFHARRPK